MRIGRGLDGNPLLEVQMYCDECGAQIPDRSTFCRNCGTGLEVAEQPKGTQGTRVHGTPLPVHDYHDLEMMAGSVSFPSDEEDLSDDEEQRSHDTPTAGRAATAPKESDGMKTKALFITVAILGLPKLVFDPAGRVDFGFLLSATVFGFIVFGIVLGFLDGSLWQDPGVGGAGSAGI